MDKGCFFLSLSTMFNLTRKFRQNHGLTNKDSVREKAIQTVDGKEIFFSGEKN